MNMYFIKNFVKFLNIIKIVFFILVLSTSKLYAQSFEVALANAYSNHPLLFSERIEGKVVTEEVADALSGWEPKVYLDGSLGKRLVTTKVKSASSNTKNNVPISMGLVVSKKLYDGGKTAQSVKIADAKFKLSQSRLLLIENEVLLNAAKSYFNLIEEFSLLDIAIKNNEVIKRQLEATRDRYEVGDLTVTDVSQAEARFSDANANLVKAKADLDIAKASFFSDIGIESEKVFYPENLPILPESLEVFMNNISKSNPNIILANNARFLAQQELDLALKEMKPSVDLEASANQAWDPNTFFEEQRYFDISANLSWPLYKGGEEESLIRKYNQKLIKSRTEIDNSIRITAEQAMIIWNTIESLKSQMTAFKASIHANEVALEGVIQEENVGARTVIDVLDAENELFRARANLIKVNTELYIANYEWLALSGKMTARSLNLPVENFYNNLDYYNSIKGGSNNNKSLLDLLK